VNSSGLIEKAKENLILQSNQFDTTWTNNDSTETGGQSGYDGSNDAWLLNKTTFNGRIEQTISKTGVLTFSVYAKAGTKNWVYLRVDGSGGNHTAYFDLSGSGALGSTSLAIDSAIEAAGNGYYRCSVTFSDTTTIARIYVADGNGDTSGTSGNIYIQDAQLNYGLIAQDYVETTTTSVVEGLTADLPRLDYSGGASCPSLLLEPSRTNLLPFSEYMLGSNWVGGQTTLTPVLSDTLSPEGVANCYRVTRSGSNNQLGSLVAITSGNTYTGSIYVRKVSGSDTAVLKDINNISTSIDITTEWKRFHTTATANSTNGRLYISPEADGDVIEVYGAQLEEGSYPTSYIPTYGASAQRNTDSCSKTGISDLIGQTEGTLFFEFEEDGNTDYSIARGFSISDGTYDNRLYLSRLSSGAIYVAGSVSGSAVIELQEPTPSSRTKVKAALAYSNNDYVLYVNGSQKATDTSAGVPSCSNLYLGQEIGLDTNSLKKPYNQVLLFKTRLSNTELAALTTI